MDENKFDDLTEPITLPETAMIMQPHWYYKLKLSGIQRLRMYCNGSKKVAPILNAVVLTWSSCVELPAQRTF